MTTRPTAVRTADQHLALPTGTRFSIRLTRTMSHRDRHSVLYRTANREVTLTLRDGTKLTGRLDETPGFFAHDQRLWLRLEGRKTRKGVPVADIRHLVGYKAPTLAEAYTALVGATSSNPSAELREETARIIRSM